MANTVIPSSQMGMGDRILVEPSEGEPFEATVRMCLGWGLINGVMDWAMVRDDGQEFTYGMHVKTPVELIEKEG